MISTPVVTKEFRTDKIMRYIDAGKRNTVSFVSLGLIYVTPVPYRHSSNVVQVLENFFLRYSFQTPSGLKREIYRPLTWSVDSGAGNIHAVK
jgi:hypothetical protein